MPIVSIAGTPKTFNVEKDDVLYDALFDRGEELPHGCLSGSCGACRVEVVEGIENLQPPGAIEKDTLASLKEEFIKKRGEEFIKNKEIRLSCRSKVIGDVSIKPLK